jgi:hypothetical protein
VKPFTIRLFGRAGYWPRLEEGMMEQPVIEDPVDALDIAAQRIADGVVAGIEAGLLRAASPALAVSALVTAGAFVAALGRSTAGIAGRDRRKRRRAAAVAN